MQTSHTAIIWDDFGGRSMAPGAFLTAVDKYPLQLQVKGSTMWAAYTEVYITTNIHPRAWWPNWYAKTPAQIFAVKRRIHKMYMFKTMLQPSEVGKSLEDRVEDGSVELVYPEEVSAEEWEKYAEASGSAAASSSSGFVTETTEFENQY